MILSKNLFRFAPALLLIGSSCSSLPKKTLGSANELYEAACSGFRAPGKSNRKVTGSIWAKVDSPELAGQFPATVLAERPDSLALEVTNLIGSPQAWLKMEGGKVSLKLTPANQRAYGNQSVKSIWGGLPLEFAPELFLGRVPCPNVVKNPDLRISSVGNQLEVIETDSQTKAKNRYLYSFTSLEGRPWPTKLIFQGTLRSGHAMKVEFGFEDPHSEDGSPERWSATSSRGTATVRWKDRIPERQ